MKKFLLILGIMLTVSNLGFGEAVVIPSGSTVIFPDSTPNLDISTSSFLLSRSDMEEATLALETVKIQEDEITKLQSSWNSLLLLTIGLSLLSLLGGILAGHLIP
jgi:hypothetical protein